MSEQFDEAMVEAIARSLYDEDFPELRWENAFPGTSDLYRRIVRRSLATVFKTHAVVPLEEYNILCGLPSKVRRLLADLAQTLAEEHERYAEKLVLQAGRIFEECLPKEAPPDVRPSTP